MKNILWINTVNLDYLDKVWGRVSLLVELNLELSKFDWNVSLNMYSEVVCWLARAWLPRSSEYCFSILPLGKLFLGGVYSILDFLLSRGKDRWVPDVCSFRDIFSYLRFSLSINQLSWDWLNRLMELECEISYKKSSFYWLTKCPLLTLTFLELPES